LEPDIPLKTSAEVARIRRSCRLATEVLSALAAWVEPGVSTEELDRLAAERIHACGAETAVVSRFPGSVCLSVNEVAAHGIPSSYRLRLGDTLIADVALCLEGWCGDAAATFAVGNASAEVAGLLAAARAATAAGVAAARAGARIGDIGSAIESVARDRGFHVLADFTGHGIGRRLHEEPAVPHTGLAGEGLHLVPGMVITIEPVLSLGCGEVLSCADGWSYRLADGGRAAQFEHTVAVFRDRSEVLTAIDF
jgi:methionyl aminopeptidase